MEKRAWEERGGRGTGSCHMTCLLSSLSLLCDFDCNWLLHIAPCCSFITAGFLGSGAPERVDQWPLRDFTRTLNEQYKTKMNKRLCATCCCGVLEGLGTWLGET